jgi:hypothetical protein
MNKRHMLSLAAALGLAGASLAQAQSTPTPEQQMPPSSSSSSSTDPSSASSPHQRSSTGTANAPTTPESPATEQSTDPSAASSPHQQESMRTAEAAGQGFGDAASGQIAGIEVISPAGDALGTVVDVVTDPAGTPAYVVISSPKGNTAMPYNTATSMVHDNAVVVERSKLNNAPKLQQGAWKDNSSKSWRTESDRYWSKSATDAAKSSMKSSKKERG